MRVRPDYQPFNPANPDKAEAFNLPTSPFVEVEKPDGN